VWPCGASPGVPVAGAIAVAAGGGHEGRGRAISEGSAAPEVPPRARKPTRYEAMWTDCDPALWEYVVV